MIENDLILTDRIGNILNRGSIICYASKSDLKIGVFLGIVERRYLEKNLGSTPTMTRYVDCDNSYAYFHDLSYYYKHKIKTEQSLAYAVYDKKGNIRVNNRKPGIGQVFDDLCKSFVVVQRPEFRMDVSDIGKVLSLVDDLKAGICKDLYFEEGEDV